ncbi:MAG: hypothetical protein HOP99_09870, partial [Dermatophilaceae bacterium]|nr:hypothetical protein [Dermatophilaceae bacterium]
TILRNGEAVVVLDARSDLELRRPAAAQRPHVAAICVRGDAESDLPARAQSLHWPVVEAMDGGRRVRATRSPAGVEVHLDGPPLDRTADASSDAPSDSGGWGALDHIGFAIDTDRSDAEVSFHRTLLGLRPGPVSEFMDHA